MFLQTLGRVAARDEKNEDLLTHLSNKHKIQVRVKDFC